MNTQLLFRIVGLTTATLIFLVGVSLVFVTSLPIAMPDETRMLLGIVMMAYSMYRFYTIVRKSRSTVNEEPE